MRRALTISLSTMLPAWCFRAVLYQYFLSRSSGTLLTLLSSRPGLVFLALEVVLAVLIVLGMFRFGLGRSEYWWLAGGLFVVAAAASSIILGAALGDDSVLFDWVLSTVYGYWLVIFVVGALAWRRWTPTCPPKSWTRPPSANYDDG